MTNKPLPPESPGTEKPDRVNGVEVDLRRRPELSGWRLLVCAVLINAGIAAVFSAGFARQAADAAPRVASVRFAEMVAEHVDGSVQNNGEAEVAAQNTRFWALALEAALAEVAARHGVVLLPARSVISGASDLTAEVEVEMARILAAEAEGGP